MIKLVPIKPPVQAAPPPPPPRLQLTKSQSNFATQQARVKADRALLLFKAQSWKSWDSLKTQAGIIVGPHHTMMPLTLDNLTAALNDYVALAAPATATALTKDTGIISTAAVRADITHHNVAIEQFILRPQQRKSVDQIIEVLWEKRLGNAVLNPLRTGAGKSIIAGTIIKYLQDNKWLGVQYFMPQARVIFLTKKAVVTKIIRTFRRMGIKNVGELLFGNDVCVTHYGALRAKANSRFFEDFTDTLSGNELVLKRYRGEAPQLVILDECQEIKKWSSTRTQYVWGFHHNKNGGNVKWLLTSATPGVTLNDMMSFAVFAGIKADDVNQLDRSSFPTWVRRFGADPRKPNGAAMERFRDFMGALVVSPPNDPSKVKATNRCTLLDFKTPEERTTYLRAEQEYVAAIQRVGKGISDRGMAMVQFMIYRAKCELLSVPYVVELALQRHREGFAPVIALSFQESVRDVVLALVEAGIPRSKISLIWGGDKAITENEIFKSDEAGQWVLMKVKLDEVVEGVKNGFIKDIATLVDETARALRYVQPQLKIPVTAPHEPPDMETWDIDAANEWVYEHLLDLPLIKSRYKDHSLKKLTTRYRKWTKYTYERVKRDEKEDEARERREKLLNLKLSAMPDDERQREIDRFQDGTTEFCIYTLSAGGTGVDLDHQIPQARQRWVYSTVCYYAEEFMQALGRCMRVATISDVVQEIIFFNNTIAAKHVAPKLMKKVRAIAKIASSSDDLVSVLEAAVLEDNPGDEKFDREVVDDTASEVDDAAFEDDDN